MQENNFPKLHNATWPGIVGKGPDSEPPIPFDDMLNMTAAAEVDGIKFDGIDIGAHVQRQALTFCILIHELRHRPVIAWQQPPPDQGVTDGA